MLLLLLPFPTMLYAVLPLLGLGLLSVLVLVSLRMVSVLVLCTLWWKCCCSCWSVAAIIVVFAVAAVTFVAAVAVIFVATDAVVVDTAADSAATRSKWDTLTALSAYFQLSVYFRSPGKEIRVITGQPYLAITRNIYFIFNCIENIRKPIPMERNGTRYALSDAQWSFK